MIHYMEGAMKKRRNSIANAMELRFFDPNWTLPEALMSNDQDLWRHLASLADNELTEHD